MGALTGAEACLPTAHDVAWVGVEESSAVGKARRAAAAIALQLGFPPARVAEVELAVTELGTNLVKHAQQGMLLLRSVRTVTDGLVEVVAVDSGPGMVDVASALRDGHSTAESLGIGLGAVQRLADSCQVFSSVGTGTLLVARFQLRRGAGWSGIEGVAAGVTRPFAGEQVCGDGYAVRRAGDRLLMMLCDGAGHGPLAASASQRAVREFCNSEAADADTLVRQIDRALAGTRGGAVAVAELDATPRTVRFTGIGNISGSVVADGRRRGMVCLPGIAGHPVRTIRSFDYPLPSGAVIVLHSDGLSDRWTADTCAAVLGRPPLFIAMTLLRDAGTRHDDASIVVAKADP